MAPTFDHKRGESLQHALELTKTYRQRDTWKAIAAILSNYSVIATCIGLSQSAATAWSLPEWITRALYAFSIIVIASRLRALENLVHEASHNNLFPSAIFHRHLQFLYAFPVFRIVEDYRRSHLIHHKHLGDPNRDPDVIRFFSLGLDCLPERPLWYLLGLPMTGFLTYEYLTTTFWEFWESSSQRFAKTAFWASLALGLVYTRVHWGFVYYFLVPFFLIVPVTRYWAEVSEHLGLDLRGEYGGSRTNVGFVHQWYLNPHNDGYHAVHHLCSQIPFYLLPQVHTILERGSEDFASRSLTSYGVMKTFRQLAAGKTIVKDSRS